MTDVRAILCDIEGTTSSIAFVTEVLFPYAERHLSVYLDAHWHDPEVQAALSHLAIDTGTTLATWGANARVVAEDAARRFMAGDVKATGLKQLQGLIWQQGYAAGELRSHVYPDVPPALRAWHAAGLDVRVYSSGSVGAQKQFFAQTEAGNLLPLFRGHYDTLTGPKREADSYRTIVADLGVPAGSVLFLSDIGAELDAAATAGLQTRLVVRPGNAPVSDGQPHAVIRSFAELRG